MSEQRDTGSGIERRSFLKRLTVLGLGAGVLGACARTVAAGTPAAPAAPVAGAAGAAGMAGAMQPAVDRIGVQLYTVRDLLAQDFEGTLERVAAIGYRRLEFAGYYDRTPAQVRALLDRLQLTAPSTHVGVPLLRRDLPAQLALARTIGHEYVTAPSYPVPRAGTDTPDDWKRIAAEFNAWGAACRAEGLRFAFHNHAVEFRPVEGGPTGMDVLVRETDPALVDFELDLYWARHAGQDPLDWFRRYPGRFTMWHVKDMTDPQGAKGMAPVGQGTTDFAALFAQAQPSGLKHFFVEHDNAAQMGGSLQSLEASYAHLRRLLA